MSDGGLEAYFSENRGLRCAVQRIVAESYLGKAALRNTVEDRRDGKPAANDLRSVHRPAERGVQLQTTGHGIGYQTAAISDRKWYRHNEGR